MKKHETIETLWSCDECYRRVTAVVEMADAYFCIDCLKIAVEFFSFDSMPKDAKSKPEVEEVTLNQDVNVVE